MVTGTQPIEGGHLIFDTNERTAFLRIEPSSARFMRPFLGTQEFLNGIDRWILALQEARSEELRSMPHVMERLRLVTEFRKESQRASTKAIADYPTRFNVETIPTRPFLAVPEVSSENREYIPIGWLSPPVIPSNKLRLIDNADLWHFGVITSAMHMAWCRMVGGRLESRFQYSVGINYNCFPWPQASERQQARIRLLAQAVLDARSQNARATFDDLYDTTAMDPQLRRAHRALDAAVDRLYRASPFNSDRERVEFLFGLYELALTPLPLNVARPSRRRKRAGQ
jgi:hypothetical protein